MTLAPDVKLGFETHILWLDFKCWMNFSILNCFTSMSVK